MNETRTVLANLDWLIHHLGVTFDYEAGVIFNSKGEPEFMLEDLATIGLTPATEPPIMWLDPALWDASALVGRVIRFRVSGGQIQIENARIALGLMDHSDLAAEKPRGHTDQGELGPE